MHHLILVIGIVLLPKAYTLRCYDCGVEVAEACTDKIIECPEQGQQCGVLGILSYAGSIKIVEINMKSCFFGEQCMEGSANFGTARIRVSSRCCSSDLCNKEPISAAPSTSKPNGKKCLTCLGTTCSVTVDCVGSEDYCISTQVKIGNGTADIKGCASKQICSNYEQLGGIIGEHTSCCQGNLCNSNSGTGAIPLLVLLAPLLSPLLASFLFS
ncbi:urokinase plasminogen activator surface receptor-like isoform X1 [Xyrichtys novacula]|uniref:Urokinase plasminogen activator surface receptor-like isoform X1 n=1 Tax=Xyrichtys novacula TaxID=13765 RepID=A0AAV1FMT6_XYRNO|nr:urokinase plasminogen activator surface receptor-like isoform X1 [Xyrichtys novacula]